MIILTVYVHLRSKIEGHRLPIFLERSAVEKDKKTHREIYLSVQSIHLILLVLWIWRIRKEPGKLFLCVFQELTVKYAPIGIHNIVPKASVSLVLWNGQERLWINPNPETETLVLVE